MRILKISSKWVYSGITLDKFVISCIASNQEWISGNLQVSIINDQSVYFLSLRLFILMTDLDSRNNIEILVTTFYNTVKDDPLLAPVFAHVDWDHHLPIMVDFWSSMLLGDMRYKGNPFQKHIGLPITAEHFGQWLKLFMATVDENFGGPKAEEAKSRAQSIAGIFQHKLGLTNQ